MDYLYPDGERFPLQVNFIELLRDAVDCAVELLLVHQRATECLGILTEIERLAARSGESLSLLESQVERALEDAAPPSERAAARIREALRSIVASERSAVQAQLAQDSALVTRDGSGDRARVMRAVERLLRQHDLPDTQVGLNLELPVSEQPEPYRGRVLLASSLGIDAMLVLAVPEAHRFALPLQVGEVAPALDLNVELRAGLFGRGTRTRRVRMDKMFVTEVTFAPGRASVGLRRRPTPASEGFDLALVRGDAGVRAELVRVNEHGGPYPEPAQRLGMEDTAAVERMMNGLGEPALDLGRHRGRLEQATLDGVAVGEGDTTAELARRLIGMLVPTASELSRRSASRTEFALKRDLGDGRREELYLSKASLMERVRLLAPELRSLFAPLDLDPDLPPPVMIDPAKKLSQALPAPPISKIVLAR